MKQLKDYLHFYLGCDCIIGDPNWKLSDIADSDRAPYTDPNYGRPVFTKLDLHVLQQFAHKTKPILRPLSDMKKEDVDLGDFIPEFELLIQRGRNSYCVELDSVHDDGYFLTIYPDGSMFCICKDNNENYPFQGGDLFKQLLLKGFDLFELIESGLAIDKTTYNQQQV